jgi:hypothetical protein
MAQAHWTLGISRNISADLEMQKYVVLENY